MMFRSGILSGQVSSRCSVRALGRYSWCTFCWVYVLGDVFVMVAYWR